MKFSEAQIEFLSTILEENVNADNVLDIIDKKQYKLYFCKECEKLILHDNYEFWNITDCCDDNSKILEDGSLLCEVCYSKSFENALSWLKRRPEWAKEVTFDIKKFDNRSE